VTEHEPKLLVLACTWCAYAGADRAGGLKLNIPGGARIVRVMCSGRVDPQAVLEAFRAGADGVLVLGCHPGDCHYKEGNYRARNRLALVSRLLPQLGISPNRLRVDWVGAGEGERFSAVVADMYEALSTNKPLVLPRMRTKGARS
jgi:coenzyme F420-reducing hydrogenase delta subunit